MHKYDSDLHMFRQDMSMELLCVHKKVHPNSDFNNEEIVAVFWIQFQLAKYSYVFAYGHMHYREQLKSETKASLIADYEVAAKNCAYLSAYLGTFPTFYMNRKQIGQKFFNYYRSGKKWNLYTTVPVDSFPEFQAFLELLDLYFVSKYRHQKRTIEIVPNLDFNKGMTLSPETLYDGFLQVVFYGQKERKNSNPRAEDFVGDKELCKSTEKLFNLWKAPEEKKKSWTESGSSCSKEEDKKPEKKKWSFSKMNLKSESKQDKPILRSRVIELLREIEILKIESQLNEKTYNEIKYGLSDEYTVRLIRIEKKLGIYHEAFANLHKHSGGAVLANGKQLTPIPKLEPIPLYYQIPA